MLKSLRKLFNKSIESDDFVKKSVDSAQKVGTMLNTNLSATKLQNERREIKNSNING